MLSANGNAAAVCNCRRRGAQRDGRRACELRWFIGFFVFIEQASFFSSPSAERVGILDEGGVGTRLGATLEIKSMHRTA